MAGKRYIVSFKEEELSAASVAGVLSISEDRTQSAIGIMATSEDIPDGDALVFERIGAAVVSLSEGEAKTLKESERVVEVVEDIDVFALGIDDNESELGTEGGSDNYFGGYSEGYRRAWEEFAAGTRQERTIGWTPNPSDPIPICPPYWPPRPFPLPPRPWPWPFPIGPLRPRDGFLPGLRPSPRFRGLDATVSSRENIDQSQPVPWNIQMVKADQTWNRVTGRGVKVAVLDTGIDEDHPDLTVENGVSFVPGLISWDDDQGHGTHCAGIVGARNNAVGVVGVAPESLLYAVKVLNRYGSGKLSWILAGMEWVLEESMDVVSMSLGSLATEPDQPFIVAYERAAKRLMESGCIVIAAAGNSGHTDTPWVGNPARCPSVMAVGSVDSRGIKSYFSSYGPIGLPIDQAVEIMAPGTRIYSTLPGGTNGSKSGTSMACPHVSGAAALLKQKYPSWGADRIRERLRHTATDLGAPGGDPEYGFGLLDCFAAL